MSNYSFSVAVVVPIRLPIKVMVEYSRTLPIALEELSNLSGLVEVPVELSKTSVPIAIDVLDRPDAVKGFSEIWRPPFSFNYHLFLRFSADVNVELNEAEIDWGRSDRSASEKESMTRDLAYTYVIEDITMWIGHLLTATIIALPASIQADAMTAIIDDGIYVEPVSTIVRCRHEAVEFAKECGWPPVRDIQISKTWEWFRRLPGLETGIVAGSIGRAVASLTYIALGDSAVSDLGGDLIWASLGLEAMYGRGSVGISEQLREKSELLLGKYDGLRKRLATAYDLRSRFLHGDVNIPFKYSHAEDGQIDKLHSEIENATAFMEALLISSLQELVVRNATDLFFSYNVSTN